MMTTDAAFTESAWPYLCGDQTQQLQKWCLVSHCQGFPLCISFAPSGAALP